MTVTQEWTRTGNLKGPAGGDGDPGPPGPTAVSADPDNMAVLGSDSLIYVPEVTEIELPPEMAIVHDGEGAPPNDLGAEGDYYLDTEGKVLYGPKAPPGGATATIDPIVGQTLVLHGPQQFGLKYRFSVNGMVTALRFKPALSAPANEPGIVLQLWENAMQALLASVAVATELVVPGAWLEVPLTTPVPVTAGTTYMLGVFLPTSNSGLDYGTTATTAVVDGDITCLADGTDGTSGAYQVPPPRFPNIDEPNYRSPVAPVFSVGEIWPVALRGFDPAKAVGTDGDEHIVNVLPAKAALTLHGASGQVVNVFEVKDAVGTVLYGMSQNGIVQFTKGINIDAGPGAGIPLITLRTNAGQQVISSDGSSFTTFSNGIVVPQLYTAGIGFTTVGATVDMNGGSFTNLNRLSFTGSTGAILMHTDYNAFPSPYESGFVHRYASRTASAEAPAFQVYKMGDTTEQPILLSSYGYGRLLNSKPDKPVLTLRAASGQVVPTLQVEDPTGSPMIRMNHDGTVYMTILRIPGVDVWNDGRIYFADQAVSIWGDANAVRTNKGFVAADIGANTLASYAPAPTAPEHVTRKDYVDTKWTKWSGTQAEYDAIVTKDPNTLYVVV